MTTLPSPSELLSGPRGRRLCWELLRLHAFVDGDRLDEILPRALAHFERNPPDDAAVLAALQMSVDTSMCWQPPDDDDALLRDPAIAERLRPVAEWLVGSPVTASWADPVDLADQHYTALRYDDDDEEPAALPRGTRELASWRAEVEANNAKFRRLRLQDPGVYAIVSGVWWSFPPVDVTTRSLGNRGPVRLQLVEDAMSWTRATSWPVAAGRAVRVYEISGADAWAELVRRHPFDATEARDPNWSQATGRSGRWLLPDWPSIAEEFDAVHVSVFGYLITAGRAVRVTDDAATVLAGWAPDEAYWLTDVLQVGGAPTDWEFDDDEWRRAAG